MSATFDFAIDLMLGGFASTVALVLFAAAPMRRVIMGVGLACVVGIVVIALLGPVRTGFLLVILYFYFGHFREERARDRRAETIGRAVSDAFPDSSGAKRPGSSRHRPGCSDR